MSKPGNILEEWLSSGLCYNLYGNKINKKICNCLGINNKTISVKQIYENKKIINKLIISADETLKDLRKKIRKLIPNNVWKYCDNYRIFLENEESELASLDQIKNDDMLVIYLRYIHIPETLIVSVEWAGSGKILTSKLYIHNNRPLEYLLCKINRLLPQESLSNNKMYDRKNHKIFLGHGGPYVTRLDQIKNGDTLVILPGICDKSIFYIRDLHPLNLSSTTISDISGFNVKNLHIL